MSIEINGIAHIQLNVDGPRSLEFWERLCHFLGMKTLIDGEDVRYCIGGRTGILVRCAAKGTRAFDQDQPGLHHLCFRARSREDVEAVSAFAGKELGAKMIRPAQPGDQFAPGYYSTLFEDPTGIRIEVNFVPGKGHFGREGRLGGGAGPATRYGEDGLTDAGS